MKHKTGADQQATIVAKTAGGALGLTLSEKGVVAIDLPHHGRSGRRNGRRTPAGTGGSSPLGKRAVTLLQRYFSGKPVKFDLPLDLEGATHFQKAVWKAAAAIPYGQTRSYAWIAERIGRPKAARAVGQALGANPVPVIVPCHRVITSTGTLGGFSSGLKRKEELLCLEAGRPVCSRKGRRGRKSR